MTIKTILAGLSGGTASNGTCELACRLAVRLKAHITALHVQADLRDSVFASGAEGLVATATMRWATDMSETLAVRREQASAAFAAAASCHGLLIADSIEASEAPVAVWQEKTGDAPEIIASSARFFDLAVLGRSDRVIHAPHSDTIEQTLVLSGRPVLLAPANSPDLVGETVAFAWNGSAQAVRALSNALPFLRLAKQIVVIAIGPDGATGIEELRVYLGVHGITARLKEVPSAADLSLGGQLLSVAHAEHADLLVLGGYGHAPWREALFGGATNELLGRSMMPLLLAH